MLAVAEGKLAVPVTVLATPVHDGTGFADSIPGALVRLSRLSGEFRFPLEE